MKAMILAAGRGERMLHLTANTPKPLLQIAGKPLIVWHIENLARAGINDIVINIAYLASKIKNCLGDGSKYQVNIQYSEENHCALESAGGIKQALPLLIAGGDSSFLVINADIFTDWSFDFNHWQKWNNSNYLAHLFLVTNPQHNPNGDFYFNQQEKFPSCQFTTLSICGDRAYTFSGISYFRSKFFKSVRRGSICKLAPLIRAAMDDQQISGELFTGQWLDVGTPERLNEASLIASKLL